MPQATAKLHHRGPQNDFAEPGRGGGSLAAAIDGTLESEAGRAGWKYDEIWPLGSGKI